LGDGVNVVGEKNMILLIGRNGIKKLITKSRKPFALKGGKLAIQVRMDYNDK